MKATTGEQFTTTGGAINPNIPKASRVYDFFLDGNHHFAADRQAGQAAIDMAPFIPDLIQLQHRCLKDVAIELTSRGFDIIIDFASGLPTEHHLHHHVPASTTVIYSDIDEETIAHSHDILGNASNVFYLQSDVYNPAAFLESAELQDILQGRRDVAFVTWGITLYMDDASIHQLARTLYDWSDERSWWAFNVPLAGVNPHNAAMARFLDAYVQMGEPVYARPVESCASLIPPWKVTPQGFVSILDWHRIDPATMPAENIDAVGPGGGSYGGFLVKA
jgi:hypothetical protein